MLAPGSMAGSNRFHRLSPAAPILCVGHVRATSFTPRWNFAPDRPGRIPRIRLRRRSAVAEEVSTLSRQRRAGWRLHRAARRGDAGAEPRDALRPSVCAWRRRLDGSRSWNSSGPVASARSIAPATRRLGRTVALKFVTDPARPRGRLSTARRGAARVHPESSEHLRRP